MSEEDFARWHALEAEARDDEGAPPAGEADAPRSQTAPPTATPPAEPAPAPEPVAHVDPPVGDRPTVLLADGSASDRHVLTEALRDQGWNTRVAIDGPEALVELYREPPDCFVLDLVLDGVGGLQLLSRIRDEGVAEALCVVVHSSVSESMHVHQARALGVDRFLDRDVDHPEALVEAVREQFVERGIAVAPRAQAQPVTPDDPGAFRSPFGRGGGPPGSVPSAVKQAALGQVRSD